MCVHPNFPRCAFIHPSFPREPEEACEAPASAPQALPTLRSARQRLGAPRGRSGRGRVGTVTPDGVLHPSQVRVRPGPVRGLGGRRPGPAGRLLPLLHVSGARTSQQQPAALPAGSLRGCPRVRLSLPSIRWPAQRPGWGQEGSGGPPGRLGL